MEKMKIGNIVWKSRINTGKTIIYNYDDNNDPMNIQNRIYFICDLYVIYDLNVIQDDNFMSLISMITAEDEDAFMAINIIKRLKRSPKFQFSRKFNRRQPYSKTLALIKALTDDNICPDCGMQTPEFSKSKGTKCPNTEHIYDIFLTDNSALYNYLKRGPATIELCILACRAMYQNTFKNKK